MATISSLGIASGIDSNSIVSQLVALEKTPLTKLQTAATLDKAQITAFGQMQSEFSALADAAKAMVPDSAWQARTTSSSNTSAATITATSSATPTAFSLDVDKLAKTQSIASSAINSGSVIAPDIAATATTPLVKGGGTLTIQLGSWPALATPTSAQSQFVPDSSKALTSIAVSNTDTVASIAAKINAANAGVVATAFNDGGHDRLLLTSKSTGAFSGFQVLAKDASGNAVTDGSGLSQLAFNPAQVDGTGAAVAGSGAYGMAASGNPVQFAQDAQARINGLAVTSSTNTLTNNIPGVTINLLATTTTNYVSASSPGTSNPVNMSVTQDVTGVVKNVQAFVTAYNTLVTDIANNTKYDAATNTPALFQGDGSVLGLQSILRTMIGSVSNGSAAYQRLSDVGIQVAADGTLALNTTKLATAANNGTEMQKLFTTDNKNIATNGFALKFANFASGALASGGLVTTKASALQKVLDQNAKDQQAVNDKATAVQTRLKAQYTALDKRMSSLTALSTYVSQQITTWNKTSA